MGKILDRLRLVGGSGSSGGPEAEPGEDVPFIEIGPHRHVEGSPDVMAVPPPARKPSAPQTVLLRPLTLTLEPPTRPRMAPELVAYHAPGDPASARYVELLPGLLESANLRAGGTCHTVLFTATRPEIGQTAVLLNLAVTAARQGRRVVVMDANLRRPGVASRLGLNPGPGVAEVLAGDCALIEALQPTAQEGLFALPAGTSPTVFTEQQAVRTLIDVLAGQHDLVFIDAPRWDGRMVAVLAGVSQAVFLAAPATEADVPPASELVRELPARGIPLAGCILTGG